MKFDALRVCEPKLRRDSNEGVIIDVVDVKMLSVDPSWRLCTLVQLRSHSYMSDVDFDLVLQRRVTPTFVPSVSNLIYLKQQPNCVLRSTCALPPSV